MKLYHGTNGRWLENILRQGLVTRGQNSARDNWKHVAHRSNPRCVYLTDSYAPYFAFNATRGKEPSCAVIEVDTDLLDEQNLVHDEDCWEQIGRGRDGVPGDMSARTLWYRARQFDPDQADRYSGTRDGSTGWRLSLKALGTCAHRGTIPESAITRAVVWPHLPNVRLAFVWDPSITLMNQRICGDRYRALTAKLFAGEFTDPKTVTIEDQMDAAMDPTPTRAILPVIEDWRLIDLEAQGGV